MSLAGKSFKMKLALDANQLGLDDEQEKPVSLFSFRLFLVVFALISASISFLVLLGLTPIRPEQSLIPILAVNIVFALCLFAMIFVEVYKLFKARRKGKAAAKLHIRIVGLFSGIAITPAILVAVVSSITLDLGLDHWFSLRTQAIVNSSLSVARAYEQENARYLNGQVLSMANDLDSSRSLFTLDRTGFKEFLDRQTKGRELFGAQLVDNSGTIIMESKPNLDFTMPAIPQGTIEDASSDLPALISSGRTNLVGAVIKLRNIRNAYLYVVRSLDEEVIRAKQLMEAETAEYNVLGSVRSSLQIAFAVLFVSFALILLLSSIWMAIAVADRLVRPIRRLITASTEVASGDYNVSVQVHSSDGDVGSLTTTFNNMISDIKVQRDEILIAKDLIDDRRRFTEAVLTGVSAGVIGIGPDGVITIANKSASQILNQPIDKLIGAEIDKVAPGFASVFMEAGLNKRNEYRSQITMTHSGKEHNLDVKVTREKTNDGHESYVVTVDDITDLVIAQRSTAWADVARRIAHEIKNPLTPIQLSAERIRRRFGKNIPEDGRAVFEQCTDTIIRQVGDIGRMVNEFSSFARMPKAEKSQQDLRDILKEAIFSLEVTRSDIKFEQDLSDDPLNGAFDARMLGQAFGNLIKNATEAIDAVPSDKARDKKRVLIRARKSSSGEDYIVDIIDNGNGLPKENRHRLLEPYMTMREKGTGLGLAIVKKIAEDHEGSLELHDAPKDFDENPGAMFRVILSKESGEPLDENSKIVLN
jgi:two-component system nitrogen regulation sensor histidine kinase NtrY